MTPGFIRIIEDAHAAGYKVEPYGSAGAVLIRGDRDHRYKKPTYRIAVILWSNGWAQDATVDLSVARMVRP